MSKSGTRTGIFDLSQLVPKNNDIEVKYGSSQGQNQGNSRDVDQASLLIGYIEVEPSQWDKLPYRTHIRYLRTDNTFRKGGFVKSVVHTTDQENKPTIKIDLVSNFSPSAIAWSIYKGNTKTIWKKMDDTLQPQIQSVDITDLKDSIEFLKQSLESVTKEIVNIKNDQTRTVNLIKKLHNLK